MSRKISNDFEEFISGHKIWSLEFHFFFHFLRNRERYCHEILRDDRSIYCGVRLGYEDVGHHFWPSHEVKKGIEIFNVYHSNKRPMGHIAHLSNTGSYKNTFRILIYISFPFARPDPQEP
jgi:hypothetical protein